MLVFSNELGEFRLARKKRVICLFVYDLNEDSSKIEGHCPFFATSFSSAIQERDNLIIAHKKDGKDYNYIIKEVEFFDID